MKNPCATKWLRGLLLLASCRALNGGPGSLTLWLESRMNARFPSLAALKLSVGRVGNSRRRAHSKFNPSSAARSTYLAPPSRRRSAVPCGARIGVRVRPTLPHRARLQGPAPSPGHAEDHLLGSPVILSGVAAASHAQRRPRAPWRGQFSTLLRVESGKGFDACICEQQANSTRNCVERQ